MSGDAIGECPGREVKARRQKWEFRCSAMLFLKAPGCVQVYPGRPSPSITVVHPNHYLEKFEEERK